MRFECHIYKTKATVQLVFCGLLFKIAFARVAVIPATMIHIVVRSVIQALVWPKSVSQGDSQARARNEKFPAC